MHVEWRLPPELEFVSGRSNRGTTVSGSGQQRPQRAASRWA